MGVLGFRHRVLARASRSPPTAIAEVDALDGAAATVGSLGSELAIANSIAASAPAAFSNKLFSEFPEPPAIQLIPDVQTLLLPLLCRHNRTTCPTRGENAQQNIARENFH